MKSFEKTIRIKLMVILLQVLFLLAVSSSCLAYFDGKPAKRPIKTITSNSNLLPSSATYYFVWSDNYEFHNHFSSENIVVKSHASINFLIAFYVPVLEPLIQQRELYIPSEFSFENHLYANLKIKRLVTEYNSNKDRSNSVLKNLDVPYIKWTPSYEVIPEKNNYSSLNKMDRIYNYKNKSINLKVPRYINQLNYKNSKELAINKPLYRKQQPINSSSQTTSTKSKFNIYQDKRNSYSETEASDSQNNGQNYDNYDSQMPLFLRIIVYAMKNKLEVLIYLCIILGFFRLIRGYRKFGSR